MFLMGDWSINIYVYIYCCKVRNTYLSRYTNEKLHGDEEEDLQLSIAQLNLHSSDKRQVRKTHAIANQPFIIIPSNLKPSKPNIKSIEDLDNVMSE